MKSIFVKNLYYLSVAKFSIVSFWWHKLFHAKRFENAFVNIGCGPKYVNGMINIDGNIFRKKDIWLDITLGLPFRDNSIQGVYASHVLEHFNIGKVRRLLCEFHRILKPGGAVRIVVPSLEYAIEAYRTEAIAALPEWPEKFHSIGGRFYNFILCANQHLLMFDFSFLTELLHEAGFKDVSRTRARVSRRFAEEHMQFEPEEGKPDSSLYCECVK